MNRSQEYVEQVRIYLEDSRVKLQMSEDFEDANCLNHWNGGGAGGGSGVRSTATQKNGEASLLVATNAALNDAWAQQSITAFTTNPGILVMSAWAATQIALDDLKITFNLDVMSPPYFYRPYIQWLGDSAGSGTWQYQDSVLGMQDMPVQPGPLQAMTPQYAWNYVEVAVDIPNNTFLWFRHGDVEVDLSDHAILRTAHTQKWLGVAIGTETLLATASLVHFDDVKIYTF